MYFEGSGSPFPNALNENPKEKVRYNFYQYLRKQNCVYFQSNKKCTKKATES